VHALAVVMNTPLKKPSAVFSTCSLGLYIVTLNDNANTEKIISMGIGASY
jgi:hypothetical protein